MLFFIYNKDSCIIPGFGGASSPVSFSTRTVENGCSPSDLTDQEVDHLRTELAKVMHHNEGREVVYCPSLLPPPPTHPHWCDVAQMEEEIHTLRQVLLAKEKNATDIRRQLGLGPFSHLKQNLAKGWHDVQSSSP